MHSPITIEALKVLDAIARCGSFAAAANELHRVPSAISYTIQKLEEDLSVEVFDRSGHRASLTPAGKYLLEQGRNLLDATDNLVHTTRQVAEGWETRLKIAVNTLLPLESLFPAIDEFNRLGVPVEIQLLEEVFTGAWDALQSRRADLVVGADAIGRPAGDFATLPVGQLEFVFAVSPSHPLARLDREVEDCDIAEYPAVVAADTTRRLPAGTAGILARQRTLTVSNMNQKIAAQEAGVGVGWLPRPRIQEHLNRGTLVALPVQAKRSPITLHLARHANDKGKALLWFWNRLSQGDLLSPCLSVG